MNELHPCLKRLMRAAGRDPRRESSAAPDGFSETVARMWRLTGQQGRFGPAAAPSFAQWLVFRAATASTILIAASLAAEAFFTARFAAPYAFTGAFTGIVKAIVP